MPAPFSAALARRLLGSCCSQPLCHSFASLPPVPTATEIQEFSLQFCHNMAAADPRAVPRDPLPLPRCPDSGTEGLRHRCRWLAQRHNRRAAQTKRINEIVWAVNELNGMGQNLRAFAPHLHKLRHWMASG